MTRSLGIAVLIIAILLISTAAAFPAEVPEIPWKKFSDPAMLAANVGAAISPCPQGELFIAGFRVEVGIVHMVFEPESGRIAFLYDPHPENRNIPLTHVGLGIVDLKTDGAHDIIPPLRWEPYVKAKHGDLCRLMFTKPQTA